MGIDISHETEIRIMDEARKQGISVDALLERFVKDHAVTAQPSQTNAELPVWNLGAVGPLHRRDIYDDGR